MSKRLELQFTFLASADLKGIRDSVSMPSDAWDHAIAEKLALASDLVLECARHCKLLAENPELGVKRDELQHGIRSSTFRKYVIFYRIRGESIEVLRVLRAMRDIAPGG